MTLSAWIRLALALALILRPSLAPAQCTISGIAPPSDVRLARAACERAVHRFDELFGGPPPAGELVLSDTSSFLSIEAHHPAWRAHWPSSARMRERIAARASGSLGPDEELALQWETVLPHELGHVLLNSEVFARSSGATFRPPPDWLQEGVGVWMEPPEHRRDEFGILRALRPFVPAVHEVATLSLRDAVDDDEAGSTIIQTFFPCASEEACGGRPHWSKIFSVITRQFPDGRVQVDTLFHDRPPPPPDPLASNAYAYSAALVRFVRESGGPAAMSRLIDRYSSGASGADALRGLPGLAEREEELERSWRNWFTMTFFRE